MGGFSAVRTRVSEQTYKQSQQSTSQEGMRQTEVGSISKTRVGIPRYMPGLKAILVGLVGSTVYPMRCKRPVGLRKERIRKVKGILFLFVEIM